MSKSGRILAFVLVVVVLVGCGGPKPAPQATRAKAVPTSLWVDVLPSDGWFSIRATGRLGPYQNDAIIVYQDGRFVYSEQSQGQQFTGKLDADGIALWKRMFVTQAKFMTLQNDYPPGEPLQAPGGHADDPTYNDAIRYTILYREGGVVKTVTANWSGAPEELWPILTGFWKLMDRTKVTTEDD